MRIAAITLNAALLAMVAVALVAGMVDPLPLETNPIKPWELAIGPLAMATPIVSLIALLRKTK